MAIREIDRYLIESKLGQGGGGQVFRARDTTLDRPVAVKLLNKDDEIDATARRRLVHEAKAAAAIDHPYICKIFEVGEHEGHLYVAMEMVDGHTLRDTLAAKDLPVNQRIRIALEIAEALAAAHLKGIIHRDLKPSNIMLTADGHVKIMDFGIAKRLPVGSADVTHDRSNSITETGVFLGTPAYMSPEQAEGHDVDLRTDVFSLGIILFEMFAGVHPFRKTAPFQTMIAIARDDPGDVRTHWSACPPALDIAIGRMLKKDRNDRTQNATEVRQALVALTDGTEIAASSPPRPQVRSIAVLPFANLSSDPEQEFFSEGITEEVMLQLSKIRSLRVISRNSVMRFKGDEHDLALIGRQLDVDTVVEGSVRWAGNRVRISCKLRDVETGSQLWADAFSRTVDDVFGVQEDVAANIAGALEKTLSDDPGPTVEQPGPENTGSYQNFLKGRYFLNRMGFEDTQKAIGFFEESLAGDPTYARSYSGLAWAYVHAGHFNYLPVADTFPKARKAAEKALELNANLAEAHGAMALVHLFMDWDFQAADDAFRRAIHLNPNFAEARMHYSWHASARGRHEEAEREARLAVDLDPLSFMAAFNLGWVLWYATRYDEAIAEYRRTLELTPEFFPAEVGIACVHLLEERFDQAVPVFERHAWTKAQLGQAQAMAGLHDEARRTLEQIHTDRDGTFASDFEIAMIHFFLDEVDEGFTYMEKALLDRDSKLLYLEHLPSMDRFRDHARFREFYARIGPGN